MSCVEVGVIVGEYDDETSSTLDHVFVLNSESSLIREEECCRTL